MSFKGFAKSRL